MENLPNFLLKAIQNACEEFSVITYTVHGDNGKARISIMFSNSDCKQMKRKSISTLRRDNKRIKEYNNSKSTQSNAISISIDSNDFVAKDHSDRGTFDIMSAEEHRMEFDSLPSSASSFDKNVVGENIGHVIDSPVDSIKPDKPVQCKRTDNYVVGENIGQVINSPVNSIEQITPVKSTCIGKLEQKEIVINAKRKQRIVNSVNSIPAETTLGKLDEASILPAKVEFVKIVLKKSRMTADHLIGKCTNEQLIVYNIHQKIFSILREGDLKFNMYKQCVENDFEDVRETIWCTEKIQEDIETMIDYLRKTM